MPGLELVILDGPQAGRRLPVGAASQTIGRSAEAGLSFPGDNFISGMHASVQAGPQGVLVTDLRSSNGTFLNGERVTSAVASVGDVVQIGTMMMQVAVAAQSPHGSQGPEGSFKSAPVLSSPGSFAPSPPMETTMIGAPVLPRMDIPAPPPMSPSIVATTTIPRISVDGSEQFKRLDAARKPVAEPAQSALRARIAALSGPLFVMVNAGADEAIPAILAMGDVDPAKHCLWRGEPAALPPAWAPYLLQTTPDAQLLNALLDRGSGKNWLSVFTAAASLDELLEHFGKFLKVQMEQTGDIYFRFYDPQVLRDFLPTGNPSEIAMFFGPVREWLLEGETKSALVQATNGPDGFRLRTL